MDRATATASWALTSRAAPSYTGFLFEHPDGPVVEVETDFGSIAQALGTRKAFGLASYFGAKARRQVLLSFVRPVWAVLAVSLPLVSGCGGASSPSDQTPPATSPTTAAKTATPAPVATTDAATPLLPNRYTFVLVRGGDYSFSGTFSFGQPTHVSDASVTNGSETFSASEGCEANPQTDAAIPALVSLTNTTSNFSASGAAFVAGSQQSPPVIEVANYFQSGPVCRGLSGLAERQGWITEELRPGQSSTELMMIYLKNYYSPGTPTGDQALLARCRIVIAGGSDKSDNSWGVQSLRGPGATGSAASGYEIGLSG